MNVIALCLVVGVSLASFGVAMWTWWALDSVRELQFDFGRFEPRHFEIE